MKLFLQLLVTFIAVHLLNIGLANLVGEEPISFIAITAIFVLLAAMGWIAQGADDV